MIMFTLLMKREEFLLKILFDIEIGFHFVIKYTKSQHLRLPSHVSFIHISLGLAIKQ